MKERPILFSGPMVRAILDGSKTQTRRIVKPQPIHSNAGDSSMATWKKHLSHAPHRWSEQEHMQTFLFDKSPYGQPGDRLWVREAFNFAHIDYLTPGEVLGKSEEECVDDNHGFACVCGDGVMYRADGEREHPDYGRALWKPSIFMPRWASRITLEIESIRVERLQDISEEDAKAEGCALACCQPQPCACAAHPASYKAGYRELWNSINGSGSWDANPWVWVVTFNQLNP